jgi:hypothetical protein
LAAPIACLKALRARVLGLLALGGGSIREISLEHGVLHESNGVC